MYTVLKKDSDYDISDGEDNVIRQGVDDGDLDVMVSEDELRSSDDEEHEHKAKKGLMFDSNMNWRDVRLENVMPFENKRQPKLALKAYCY
ncbi:hypothetical protein M569_17068 [Genlisea aurea]|uniref:Uncharacterized protein n=1 Tax=Genlisea aurea TaxID=192259 RepID=S8BTN2_9LAMI|nr:hypothetical protein M569_17068 [Genlisea aurea]